MSQRSLVQAEKIQRQLEQLMIRFDIDPESASEDQDHQRVREALICGYFMQVAHRKRGDYFTMKDNQQVLLHPSHGIDTEPEWVLFSENVLTTRPYIRAVTAINLEW